MAAASCKKRDRSEYRLMTGFPTRDVTNPGRSIFVSREAEVEAKAKQCDFILYTDLTGMKASAAKKLGGFLGKAAGVGSGGVDKTEAKVEFQLFAVGETAARLKSAATAKEVGEASAATALAQEAKQVSAEARRRQ